MVVNGVPHVPRWNDPPAPAAITCNFRSVSVVVGIGFAAATGVGGISAPPILTLHEETLCQRLLGNRFLVLPRRHLRVGTFNTRRR